MFGRNKGKRVKAGRHCSGEVKSFRLFSKGRHRSGGFAFV
jgi:hypothetical protein